MLANSFGTPRSLGENRQRSVPSVNPEIELDRTKQGQLCQVGPMGPILDRTKQGQLCQVGPISNQAWPPIDKLNSEELALKFEEICDKVFKLQSYSELEHSKKIECKTGLINILKRSIDQPGNLEKIFDDNEYLKSICTVISESVILVCPGLSDAIAAQFYIYVSEFRLQKDVLKFFNENSSVFSKEANEFVKLHSEKLQSLVKFDRNELFQTLYSAIAFSQNMYHDPRTKQIKEPYQIAFLRSAIHTALCSDPDENRYDLVEKFYNCLSQHEFAPQSPQLKYACFEGQRCKSATCFTQPVASELDATVQFMQDVPYGSHGISAANLRGVGQLAEKIQDAQFPDSFRKPVAAIYLPLDSQQVWDLLNIKDPKKNPLSHKVHVAVWISDLFMEAVKNDKKWHLFEPSQCHALNQVYGDEYKKLYEQYSKDETLNTQVVSARELYDKLTNSLIESGEPYILFKDPIRERSTEPGYVVQSSNLCAEITQSSSESMASVCNVTTLSPISFVRQESGKVTFDWHSFIETAKTTLHFCDLQYNEILGTTDLPNSIKRGAAFRSLGIGLQGVASTIQKLGLQYDSEEGVEFERQLYEALYFGLLTQSSQLAEKHGQHEHYKQSLFEKTKSFQHDFFDGHHEFQHTLNEDLQNGICGKKWENLRCEIIKTGLRNSNVTAQQPAVYWSRIGSNKSQGADPSDNYCKKLDHIGYFSYWNTVLIEYLIKTQTLTQSAISHMLINSGSIQHHNDISDHIKGIFKSAFEVDMDWQTKHAAARAMYLEQSDSRNVYIDHPSQKKLKKMIETAHQAGLKTALYYLKMKAAFDPPSILAAPKDRAPIEYQEHEFFLEKLGAVVDHLSENDINVEALNKLIVQIKDSSQVSLGDSEILYRLDQLIRLHWLNTELDKEIDKFENKMKKLSGNEKGLYPLIIKILLFFSLGDKIVQSNIATNFLEEAGKLSPVVSALYAVQNINEEQHDKTYERLLLAAVQDAKTKNNLKKYFEDVASLKTGNSESNVEQLMREIESSILSDADSPCGPHHPIGNKIKFAQKYMDNKKELAERLFAFACVEGILFATSFAYISYIKSQFGSDFGALTTSNDFISRDESLHTRIAILIGNLYLGEYPIEPEVAKKIALQAIEAEKAFAKYLLKNSDVPGLSYENMEMYIKHIAGMLLNQLKPDLGQDLVKSEAWVLKNFGYMAGFNISHITDPMSVSSAAYQSTLKAHSNSDEQLKPPGCLSCTG